MTSGSIPNYTFSGSSKNDVATSSTLEDTYEDVEVAIAKIKYEAYTNIAAFFCITAFVIAMLYFFIGGGVTLTFK